MSKQPLMELTNWTEMLATKEELLKKMNTTRRSKQPFMNANQENKDTHKQKRSC